MFLSTQSNRREVITFLDGLNKLLEREDFDAGRQFMLITKKKPDEEEYSTPYTLLDLDYSMEDVLERIRELTVEEYSETKIDRDNLDPPQLYVFGKKINSRLIYIKLKVRGDPGRTVLCVSFHYAKDRMKFPYRR